jgi:hypothetical protein
LAFFVATKLPKPGVVTITPSLLSAARTFCAVVLAMPYSSACLSSDEGQHDPRHSQHLSGAFAAAQRWGMDRPQPHHVSQAADQDPPIHTGHLAG